MSDERKLISVDDLMAALVGIGITDPSVWRDPENGELVVTWDDEPSGYRAVPLARLAALEKVAEAARRVDRCFPQLAGARHLEGIVIEELRAALAALGGSPTEDQQTNGEER